MNESNVRLGCHFHLLALILETCLMRILFLHRGIIAKGDVEGTLTASQGNVSADTFCLQKVNCLISVWPLKTHLSGWCRDWAPSHVRNVPLFGTVHWPCYAACEDDNYDPGHSWRVLAERFTQLTECTQYELVQPQA